MFNPISRRELDQLIIQQFKADNKQYLAERFWTAKNDNFPYALREFVNSHMDLPTIDDLAKSSPKLAHCFGKLKTRVA